MIVLVLLVCENLLNVDADDYVKKESSDDESEQAYYMVQRNGSLEVNSDSTR